MGLMADARSIAERDPAARNTAEVFFLYSGFKALVYHRMAHYFYKKGHLFLARWISQWSRHFTGIEIHPGAKIVEGLFIDHGMGVVIGETAEIGDNCTIYHGVTLGGTGNEVGKRHPTIGNNVLIGSGAKVLGPFTVGDNARIAANAVVLQEVPPGATVVGAPGKVVRLYGMKPEELASEALDQINVPDVTQEELLNLSRRVCELEVEMQNMKKNGK